MLWTWRKEGKIRTALLSSVAVTFAPQRLYDAGSQLHHGCEVLPFIKCTLLNEENRFSCLEVARDIVRKCFQVESYNIPSLADDVEGTLLPPSQIPNPNLSDPPHHRLRLEPLRQCAKTGAVGSWQLAVESTATAAQRPVPYSTSAR